MELRGIQGQRAPAIPADASTLLEGAVGLFTRRLPLKPEKKRRERWRDIGCWIICGGQGCSGSASRRGWFPRTPKVIAAAAGA